MTKPPKKSAADYFETKRKLECLKALSATNQDAPRQRKLLNDIQTGVIGPAITLENKVIYRARWNEASCLFASIAELIYPPAQFAKRGRFNESGESVFYGALCELGTIIEMRPDVNKVFTISRFGLRAGNQPFFFPLCVKDGSGKDRYHVGVRNKAQSLVYNFIEDLLTKRAVTADDYNLTILLGKHYLGKAILAGDTDLGSGGLAYPSVEARFISNTTTFNLAMTPDFFEKFYEFKETFVYVLTHENTHYQLNPINSATAREDGSLEWRYDFATMKARVSEGQLLDGDICLNARLTAL